MSSSESDVSGATFKGLVFNGVTLSLITLVGYATGTWVSAGISVGVNWLVFLVHALPQSSEKFFDATGTLTYVTLTITALLLSPSAFSSYDPRQIVLAAMALVWSIRLGSYLLARIMRDGKDSRFDRLKVSFILWLGVWSMQALWCYLVVLPALIIISKPTCAASPSIPDIVGWTIWVVGMGFEVIADRQKDAWRQEPQNKGRFITTGLWAFSRHPNYFGEITIWVGVCISGMSCFAGWDLFAWMSPVTTYVLLMYVSGVPLLEKKADDTWGQDADYQWYKEHTPCVFPRLTAPPAYKPAETEMPLADSGLAA